MKGKNHRPLFLFLVAFGLILSGLSRAQQAGSDSDFVAPSSTKPSVDATIVEKPAPYDISGIVAQAFKMKKPLQMINPHAPAKYGNGQENVSWDPDKPEKPKGIILLGIQW